MKKQTKLKAFMLSVAMAVAMSLPMTMNAQNGGSDNWFRSGGDDYVDRVEINGGITNSGIGESVPLGSGLLVFTTAGACYVMLRRKRKLKTTATLLLFCAMILGITNCKKKVVETVQPSNVVTITLDVSDGSKLGVNPVFVDPVTGETYAKVEFSDGDIIYVGNNGEYVGYLTYDESNQQFSGGISGDLSTDDRLHFYFLGNRGTDSKPTSVSISDQSVSYPVISYAPSDQNYSTTETSYTAKLQNKCAIVKFPNNAADGRNITVRGMKNSVTVDFSVNNYAAVSSGEPYSFDMEGNGSITLNESGWAILLPQPAVDGADIFADGYEPQTVDVPQINANSYLDDDIESTTFVATDICGYSFRVGPGSVVRFSPGNLQYKPISQEWRFAPKQYSIDHIGGEIKYYLRVQYIEEHPRVWHDIIEVTTQEEAEEWLAMNEDFLYDREEGYRYVYPKQIVIYVYNYVDGYMEYGVYDNEEDLEAGIAEVVESGYYSDYYYEYVDAYNIYLEEQYTAEGVEWIDLFGHGTWGPDHIPYAYGSDYGPFYWTEDFPNTITLEGYNGWRTFTQSEWNYLFYTRENASYKYGCATVFGVHGYILLPDNYQGNDINYNRTSWDDNMIETEVKWQTYYESFGAVFLPAMGYREYDAEAYYVGYEATYWSSSLISNGPCALEFGADYCTIGRVHSDYRCYGRSVRLVL